MQESSVKRKYIHKDQKLNILILQIFMVVIILIFALCIKFFGGNVYRKLSVLYHEKFDDITLASDVLNPKQNETHDVSSELEYASDITSNNSIEQIIDDNDSIETSVKGYLDDYDTINNAVTISAQNQSFIWPVNGKITSEYGYRIDPFTNKESMHGGIDISAETGTKIGSAYSGKVFKTGYSNSYGYYVIISHSDSLQTLYAHCSKIISKEGDVVTKGQTIALAGSTGRSTGSHLHFEIRVGGYRINPRSILGQKTSV